MIKKIPAHLEITIVDGKLVMDGLGFEGKGCHELAELFSGLGDQTVSRRKPDFFRGGADEGVDTLRSR